MKSLEDRYVRLEARFGATHSGGDLDAVHDAYLETKGGKHFEARAFLRRKDQYRRMAWQRSHCVPLDERLIGIAVESVDPLVRDEEAKILRRAISKLPAIYRQVVELRFYEGLAPAEISERLAVPPKTIYTRIRRATETLRHLLRSYLSDGLVQGELAA